MRKRTLTVAVGSALALTAFGGTGLALAQSGGEDRPTGGGPHHAMGAQEKGGSAAGPGMSLSRGEMRRRHETMTKDPAMQHMHRMMTRDPGMGRMHKRMGGEG